MIVYSVSHPLIYINTQNVEFYRVASFIKDEKRRHDDVSRLLGWIRIPPVVQAEVGNSVGFGRAHVQLEDRNRSRINPPY